MPPYDPSLSDGCSGPVPDLGEAVRLCCVLHDRAYYLGGDIAAFLVSNISLGQCVWSTDNALWALPMVLATTLCGWIWWGRRRCPPEEERRR